MDPNFVLTVTFPEPPVDAGALIDGAFPGEHVRALARAIVEKILTDGETARYEDGRTALYLPAEHRPAVQALLDTMPAEDRQRLLGLLAGTVVSPVLEGLILGRWPSRGFLLEARAIFRIPELREHLPATPGQAFLEKLRGVRVMLQDRSPGSPAHALLDLLARVGRDTPRTPSGGHVRMEEYLARCRSDPQTLALARELSKEIQDASVALFRALRGAPSSYLPRTPGGTGGEGDELNVMDRADVADYCSFLCCVAREVLNASPGGDEMTGVACTCVTRSVIEALLVAFLQRRFPGLAAPADAELEGSQPQSAEEHERVRRQLQRKLPLFRQAESLFATFAEAARALPALVVRGEAVRTGPLVADMLTALGQAVRGWAELRLLADHVNVPRSVAPLAAHASAFLHPLPDLSMLRCLEEPSQRQEPPVQSRRITSTFCKHNLDTALVASAGTTYPEKGVGATIAVHAPAGGACLSDASWVPLSQFLHPEDPASIVAAYLARQADWDVRGILELLQVFEVEQQVRGAAADVPRLDFFHRRRAVRGRLFFWRKRVANYVYLVMRRRDAGRLGVLARVRALPAREQALLRWHFGFCPEDPVALRIEITDDPGDGGGEEPPQPPPPEPERREDPEDAPTTDKVGVG